jgi:hypothetical protein
MLVHMAYPLGPTEKGPFAVFAHLIVIVLELLYMNLTMFEQVVVT